MLQIFFWNIFLKKKKFQRSFLILKEQIIKDACFENEDKKNEFKKFVEIKKAFKEWYETNFSNDLRKAFDNYNRLDSNQSVVSMKHFIDAFRKYVN